MTIITPGEFGNVQFLVKTQPPKKDIFFLTDHFVQRLDSRYYPRFYPTKYSAHEDVFGAIRKSYPKEMLPADSKLYAIVNSTVIVSKTKKVKPPRDLGDFINHVENEGGSATIVSYSQRDFDALSWLTESRNLWRTLESLKEGVIYKVHTYNPSAKRITPKY